MSFILRASLLRNRILLRRILSYDVLFPLALRQKRVYMRSYVYSL